MYKKQLHVQFVCLYHCTPRPSGNLFTQVKPSIHLTPSSSSISKNLKCASLPYHHYCIVIVHFSCVLNSEKNILIERDIYVQIYKNFFVCMFIYLLIKACNVFLFSSVSIIWPIAVWSSFFQHVRLFKICPGSHPSLLKSSLPFDLLSNFPLVSLKKYHNIIMDVCLPSL